MMRMSNNFKLVVFDLDMTLWPFRLDKHMKSPFKKERGRVVDSIGQMVSLMDDTVQSLEYVKGKDYQIGIASRIEDICGAYQLINLLEISHYFDYREIYPGCKMKHFVSLQSKSNISFKDMIFFDDDMRNTRDVSRLGVHTVHVPNGISKEYIFTVL
ncbi:Magnesium-dependent phosphatase 1 [Frankliniella fusca]|uniref:Magnesium-dependent phosphatase 1 n=1 Tax=Frankliniella fusca TaxID=407009 RepID=A0AAE1LIY7_9NEOP|nr:Magnesium-dependent phosphatase 1 [Frankliniella fusca]